MPDNVTLDPPITNIERLLAKAAGMENVNVDDPETRIERYLKAICDRLDNGGGSGGGRFVVAFSYDEATETWSADKTFAECVAAWNAGQTLLMNDGGLYNAVRVFFGDTEEDVTYIEWYDLDTAQHTITSYGYSEDGVDLTVINFETAE